MTEDNRETNPEEPARPEAPAAGEGPQGTPRADQSPTAPGPRTEPPDTTPQPPPYADPSDASGAGGERAPGAAGADAGQSPAAAYGDQSPGVAGAGAGQSPAASRADQVPGVAGADVEQAPGAGYAERSGGAGAGQSPDAAGANAGSAPAAAYGDQAPGTSPYSGQAPGAYGTQPTASFAGSGESTPPRGYPASGDRVLYGTAFNQSTPGGYPSMSPPPGAGGGPTQTLPGPEPRRRANGLVAGLTVLALLVGGGAGAVGGYLVAENRTPSGPVENALDRPPPSEQTSSTAPAGSIEAVAAKVSPSVVQLQVRGSSSAGEGSGFVISSDGLIVTNNHVVEPAARGGQIVAVFQDGSTAAAEIVGRDPTSDVAVVRADKSGLPVVELGRSDDLRVGQGVVAFGSPFELAGTVTSGIVSSLHRPQRAGGEDGSQATVMDAIQTDAAINPGNSGGPLVNMQGQVVGINSAIYSPTQSGSVGIGFAIPIDQARRTADEIVKTGKATQTILGVTVRDNEQGGALVVDVTPGGPGEKAGIEPGDVVTKLDERRIENSDALVAAVRSHKPGDKVSLELDNGSRTVDATLAGQEVETE